MGGCLNYIYIYVLQLKGLGRCVFTKCALSPTLEAPTARLSPLRVVLPLDRVCLALESPELYAAPDVLVDRALPARLLNRAVHRLPRVPPLLGYDIRQVASTKGLVGCHARQTRIGRQRRGRLGGRRKERGVREGYLDPVHTNRPVQIRLRVFEVCQQRDAAAMRYVNNQ